VQVIIYTPWEGRSPDLIEDQVTYPIVTALISAPRVKTVRGFSDFGFSFVYAIFEDGPTSTGHAPGCWNTCSRYRAAAEGAAPVLGPDATAWAGCSPTPW